MDPRAFKTKIDICNAIHLAELLNLPSQKRVGIDMWDSSVGVEVKNNYDRWKPTNWAVHADQIDGFRAVHPRKKLYWGFIRYGLRERPKDIDPDINISGLENIITYRETWLVWWNWLRKLPVSRPRTGPYVYVGLEDFPSDANFIKYVCGKSTIYVPRRSIELQRRIEMDNYDPETPEPF